MSKKSALGRGLSALIETEEVTTSGSLSMNEIELDKIEANPNQPRSMFNEELLEELSESIKQLGLIQPITLRKIGEDKYQIISGERRFRASKMAGLQTIPAYIKEVEDSASVEMMALIENIQREDLNAIEIALSFQKLIDEFQLTQDQLSEKVGKKRATISNYLRLLRLPAIVQMALKNKGLDMGHARALLSIEDAETQLSVYDQIVREALSVRKVEELVRAINSGENINAEVAATDTTANAAKKKPETRDDFKVLEQKLSSVFNAKVQFTANEKGKGKIAIAFANEDDMERIIDMLDLLAN
jgi:ParB family chromosome partitioning protein